MRRRFDPHPGLAFVMLGLILALVIGIAVSFGALVVTSARGQDLGCAAPVQASGALITRCHKGYVTIFDTRAKVPYLVAYRLTGPHTLGCGSRKGLSFKVDKLAPAADQARPNDYRGSGYDLGHMAPNEDFAWDRQEQIETFLMTNVSPQLPGLNREGWESGEEIVRSWAFERGEIDVYVGPILSIHHKTIGPDHVAVPAQFFKIAVDEKRDEAIAFEMPQAPVPKGDISSYEASISEIEAQTGISFPVPEGVDKTSKPPFWHYDLEAWGVAHRKNCG